MSVIIIACEKCGKPIIRRYPNGVWHFMFGKRKGGKGAPVEMYIHGSLKLKCWHTGCGHENILNHVPQNK
jgi:ribosomal protein L37AE/L43A